MLCMITATSLFALLIPLAFGHLISQKRAWNAALTSPDIRYSGNYIIRNCDANASIVDAALKLLHSTLGPAIHDAEEDPPSTAYKTFFKDIADGPYIRSVLSNITTGAAMSLNSAEHARSTAIDIETSTLSPEIICISKRGQLLYHLNHHGEIIDHYEACQKRPDGGTSALLRNTPNIVLCPSFFSLDPAPAEPTCSRVNRWLNRYSTRDGGKSLIHYQLYALLHPLAQFYISATSLGRVRVSRIDECARLEARYTRENARSYEFYVANILSNCTVFPKVYGNNGRELLVEESLAENMTEHHPPPVWGLDIDMIDYP